MATKNNTIPLIVVSMKMNVMVVEAIRQVRIFAVKMKLVSILIFAAIRAFSNFSFFSG